jgi:hypothetical protein
VTSGTIQPTLLAGIFPGISFQTNEMLGIVHV